MSIFSNPRFWAVVGAIVLLAVIAAIGAASTQEHTLDSSLDAISDALPSVFREANKIDNEPMRTTPPVPAPSGLETGIVARVIDGDTIELENGEKVRYIGIDTPETVDPRKPVQCFGVEASKKNRELVEGKTVQLEKDVTDRDKYGRLLRYVYVADDMVNIRLVSEGYAYSYSYPPDVRYQDRIVAVQREASETKRGLWSACPPRQTAEPKAADTSAPQQPNGQCVIKGNISAEGEKIYHMNGCGSYALTKIDEARGEQWFCSEAEAVAAGWRKAGNCP